MILSENAQTIAKKRYFDGDENWTGLSDRVSKCGARVEINPTNWENVFFNEIHNMYFIPAGRILRNAGKIKQSMLNCGCLPIGDSIEAIAETVKNAMIMWSYGAGVGIAFSPLRPVNAPLLTKGGESSGLVSFVQVLDSVGHPIETGGQRRSGLLGMLHVSHPEIYDFIDAKLEDGRLRYCNLSVAIDKDFIYAVENDLDWNLQFGGKIYKTIKAMDLWNKILNNMIKSGEPGLINYDNLIKNNSYFFNPISAVNLCSELPLAAYELCDLGNLVLPKFVANTNTNWNKLEESIYVGVRYLDNILDANYYPIKETEIATKSGRRIGLGTMGLHDYLMLKHLRYGSERALLEIEKLFKFIRNVAYEASMSLAQEKGTFPKYIKSEYANASFIKKLPPKLRMKIKEHGMRNVCVLCGPPAGTTSLLPEVSSGIEPHNMLAYRRKDRVSERLYIHPAFEKWILSGEKKKPDWLVDASDLTPEDHLETQATIQRYFDNSVSKTINCPKNMTANKLSKLLLEYIADLKGVTVYVDGSKAGQVYEKITLDEAIKIVKSGAKYVSTTDEVKCKSGSCDL